MGYYLIIDEDAKVVTCEWQSQKDWSSANSSRKPQRKERKIRINRRLSKSCGNARRRSDRYVQSQETNTQRR